MKESNLYKTAKYLVFAGLFLFSIIATIKTIFVGVDVDEQYALTMSYRIARGELLIKEMWEPHQLSGIIPALFIKLFLALRGSATGILVYLRIVGAAMQLGICTLWFAAFRNRFCKDAVLITAIGLFNVLPKWILMPEFANQQIWYMLAVSLLLLLYFEKKKKIFCYLAGVFMAMEVLAYPSCLIVFVVILACLFLKDRNAAWRFLAVDLALGLVFLIYVFTYCRGSELIYDVKMILSDGSHKNSFFDTILVRGAETLEIAGYLLVLLIISAGLSIIGKLIVTRKFDFKISWGNLGATLMIVTLIDQCRLWILALVPNVHPQLHFLVPFIIGGVLLMRDKVGEYKELFLFMWLPALASLVSVILLTNLDIKASLVHLIGGVLCTGLIVLKDYRKPIMVTAMIAWIGVLLFGRIFLIRANEGTPVNITCAKQKVTNGPLKNIYCEYMTGYRFNDYYSIIGENVFSDDSVMYVGLDMCIYMLSAADICTPSTISTPTFNERDLEYLRLNPGKVPDVLILDKDYYEIVLDKNSDFAKWINENYDLETCVESEFLRIVRK